MYDIIILGAGPGGYIAAEKAAAAKKSVLLIEKEFLGGVCLNRGCIPTKTLLNSAKYYKHAQEGVRFGVTAEKVNFDFPAAMAWKGEVVDKLRKGIAYTMKAMGITVVEGTGEIEDKNTIVLKETGEKYSGKNLIIAAGSSSAVLPVPGAASEKVTDSTGILELKNLPESIVIIGGGVIGLEFASFFHSLGVKVQVIEMMEEIVPNMDRELAQTLRRALRGIEFYLSSKVTRIEGGTVYFAPAGTNAGAGKTSAPVGGAGGGTGTAPDGGAGAGLSTSLAEGKTVAPAGGPAPAEQLAADQKADEKSVSGDLVLMAVGRKPNLTGYGLEKLNLDTDRRGIRVNEKMETSLPGVYAVGDVTGLSLLAHSASRMGEVAVSSILGGREVFQTKAIPWVVYTQPEAAGVGLTEQEALSQNIKFVKSVLSMKLSGRFAAENGFAAPGICKVLADADTGELLGIHMAGSYSSEIIYGAAAMIQKGMKMKEIKEIVFPHPTVAEILKETISSLTLETKNA